MEDDLLRIKFKGVPARWVLEHVTDEPTPEKTLLAGLEAADLGAEFLKREAPGHLLDESLAWVIYGLEGAYRGFGPPKNRWLPVRDCPQRRAAHFILEQLPDAAVTVHAKELVNTAKKGGHEQEPFCGAASWMLERVLLRGRLSESEEVLRTRLVRFWDTSR